MKITSVEISEKERSVLMAMSEIGNCDFIDECKDCPMVNVCPDSFAAGEEAVAAKYYLSVAKVVK